jgi:hypothetical protein
MGEAVAWLAATCSIPLERLTRVTHRLQRRHRARLRERAHAARRARRGEQNTLGARHASCAWVLLQPLFEEGLKSFPEDGPDRHVDEMPGCQEGKGGAYAAAVTFSGTIDGGDNEGYSAKLALLHADLAGVVSKSRELDIQRSPITLSEYSFAQLFDYDHDGVDELLTTFRVASYFGDGAGADVWKVVGSEIVPYPPSAGVHINSFRDVDADGLPDLVLQTPFQGEIAQCGGDRAVTIEFGPDFVMHAQPDGGFVVDSVSYAELSKACPKSPAKLVPRTSPGIDNDELRKRLACAAVWGKPATAIVGELRASCPAPHGPEPDPLDCAYEGILRKCFNLQRLLAWAVTPLPFTLPQPDHH